MMDIKTFPIKNRLKNGIQIDIEYPNRICSINYLMYINLYDDHWCVFSISSLIRVPRDIINLSGRHHFEFKFKTFVL